MRTGFSQIQPMHGLGDLTFGMSRQQALSLLGEPTEKETFTLDTDYDERTEAWHYDDGGLSLSFDEAFDWKLSSMAASSEDYTLEGVSLVGKDLAQVQEIFENKGWGQLQEDEEMEADEEMENSRLFFVEEKAMSLWFENGTLTEIQWNAPWEEEE